MPRLRDLILKPSRRHPCPVTALDGETLLPLELRLLDVGDVTAALREGRAYAKKNGVEAPAADDVLFARGKMIHTLLLACCDPDSPLDKPVRFFDDVEQIERMLDDARIAYVYQEQQDFQGEFSPSPVGVRPEEFVTLVTACADEWKKGPEGDPERPFAGLPSRKLRSFAAQLVGPYMMLTELRSQLGSATPPVTSASSEPTAPSSGAQE